jgi:hypothetical protein
LLVSDVIQCLQFMIGPDNRLENVRIDSRLRPDATVDDYVLRKFLLSLKAILGDPIADSLLALLEEPIDIPWPEIFCLHKLYFYKWLIDSIEFQQLPVTDEIHIWDDPLGLFSNRLLRRGYFSLCSLKTHFYSPKSAHIASIINHNAGDRYQLGTAVTPSKPSTFVYVQYTANTDSNLEFLRCVSTGSHIAVLSLLSSTNSSVNEKTLIQSIKPEILLSQDSNCLNSQIGYLLIGQK